MTDKSLLKIQKQIEQIKQELMQIGEMRPGSLTRQYRNPRDKKWGFYQISYTYKMKSKTEYVRPQHVNDIREQIKTYKRFKRLVEKWIDLAIKYSRVKMDIAKRKHSG